MTRQDGERQTDSGELRSTFRQYKRGASLLRDVLEAPSDELALSFTFSSGRDRPTSSDFSAGAHVDRHAALLRPFMDPRSSIELRRVWSLLLTRGCVDAARINEVDAAFSAANDLAFAVEVNGEALSARDVYFAYGEGRYFGDDEAARAKLEAMSVGPMSALVQMLFHDVCAGFSGVVFAVLEAVLECERSLPADQSTEVGPRVCIYCRTSQGDFGPEEHVIPESLGGDAMVIRGCVCATCNNRLSALDQALIDFEPLSMLRPVYGPMTKKGKFPKAQLRDIDIERTAPRHVRVRQKSGRPMTPPVQQDDGSVRFSVTGTGRKPPDPVLLGRALYKIALGLVAHDAGTETALDPRYDAARAFVVSGEPIAAHLVMISRTKPGGQIRTWWLPSDSGTFVVLDFFGLQVGFPLEPSPIRPADEVEGIPLLSFWLGKPEAAPGVERAGES